MKKIIIAILLLANFGIVNQAFATHEMGGDLEYEVIDSVNKIYRIRLVLYRDCSGIPMQTQITVDFASSNGCSIPSIIIPAKPQPPSNTIAVEVTPLCNPKPLTTCSSSGSPIKGTQRYLYEAIVQFPPGCGVVTVSYNSCCRNVNAGPGSITTLSPSSSTATWLEAQINTDAKRGNNSVKFLNPPIPYICSGSLFRYNHYAIDQDGDSLVYSMYAPYTGANQAGVIYNPPLSAQKPFQMVESQIVFNQKTGQFQFTPTTPQTSIMGFLIQEYRRLKGFNGKDSFIFVGSTVRDVQVSITGPCVPIKLNGILKDSVKNGAWVDSLNVDVCKTGKALRFTWRITADGLPLDVKLNANMLGVDPAWTDSFYSFTYVSKKDSNLLKDTLWGTFRYNTPPNKIGCYPLIFNYGYCANGFPTTGSFTTTICFKDNTYADRDTVYYCDGGLPPQVNVYGGDTFAWNPMTGIVWNTVNGSSVKMAPPTNIRYIVTSNLNVSGTCKKTDTVDLIYVPKFTYTLAPKNDTICQNQQKPLLLTLSPTQAPYEVTWVNPVNLFDPVTFKPVNNIINPIAIPSTTTNYIVDMKSRFECTIRDTIRVVVGGAMVDVKDTANRVKVCLGDTTRVKVDYVVPKICGQSSLLCEGATINVGYPGTVGFSTFPATTNVNCAVNCYPSVFGSDNPAGSAKHRIIYKKSELNSMGFTAGIIKSLTLTILGMDQSTYSNFTIRMGCINTTNANDNTVVFNVYDPKTAIINSNSDNTFNFDRNFDWDGSSNILVEFVFNNNGTRKGNTQLNTRSTTGIGLNEVAYYVPTSTGVNADNLIIPTGYSNRKPMIKFGICTASPWSPGLKIKWTSVGGNLIANDTARTTTVTVNTAGNFTSTVSGGYTCTGTGAVFIDIDTTFKPKANNDTFICTNAGIQLNITGNLGANPAATTYLWSSNPANPGVAGPNSTIRNPAPFVTTTTSFFVQIKNGPCIVYDTVVVTKQVNIPVTFNSVDPYCTSSTGYLKAIPPGNPATYTYKWTKGAIPTIIGTTDSLLKLSAGTYNVTVTNTSGCTGTNSKILNPQVVTLTLDTVNKHIACFGDNTGEIKVKVTGGSPIQPTAYTYNWNPAATPGDTVINNLAANITYSVTVTDTTTKCTGTISAKLNQPTKLNLDLDSFGVKCFGASNGAINFKATGGVRVASTTYDWSNGVLNGNTVLTFINGIPAGKYYVTVTDDNGCKAYDSITVKQPPLLTVTMTKRDAAFKGSDDGMVLATPSGGAPLYDFNWSKNPTGAGYPIARTNKTVDSLSKTIGNSVGKAWYYVTVTDDSGCVVIDSIKVNDVNCKLGASFTIDSVKCFGASTGKITAYALDTLNGPATFLYKFNAVKFANITDTTKATSINNITPATMMNLAAGYYKLYIETDKGCDTLYDSLLVKQAPQILTTVTSLRGVSCPGYSDGKAKVVTSGGTPPYTIGWNPPASTPTLDTTSGLLAGFNKVTITDNNNCVKVDSVLIATPPPLAVLLLQDSVTCNGLATGRAYVSTVSGGTAPYTYKWNNGDLDSIAQGVPKGSYTITVTDNSYAKCTVSATQNVFEPDVLGLTLNKVDISCNGANDGTITSIVTGGNGGFAYNLQPENIDNITGTYNNLGAGVKSVKVTDMKGCSNTKNITIGEPTKIVFTTGAKNATCLESSNGKAWLGNVSGGAGPNYSYAWSTTPTQTTDTAYNLAGNKQYTVTVTDQNGCTVSKNQFVGVDYILTIDNIVPTNTKCFGSGDGKATVKMFNGFAPYTYNWSIPGIGNSNVALNIPAGDYSVSVTDVNNCTTTGTVTIGQPNEIRINMTSDPATCYGYSDGKLKAKYTGGTRPYIKFEWNTNPPQYADSAVGLKAGSYTIKITDTNNCIGTFTGKVLQPDEFSLILTEQKHISCAELNDGKLSVTTKGGIAPYTYLWNTNPPRNTFTIDELTNSKTYIVTATDANGCKTTATYEIKRPEKLTFEQVVTDSITCPNYKDGVIDIHAIGGTISLEKLYEYSLDGVNYVLSGKFTKLAKGRYSVYIKDNNGCVARREVELFEPERLFIDIVPNDTLLDLAKTAFLNLNKRTISGIIPRINSYKWYPSEGLSCNDCESPLAEAYESRKYRLVYNYLNACVDTTFAFVRVKDPLDIFIPSAFTPGNSDGLGINETFKIYGNGMKRIMLRVFNRWGEKIYETHTLDEGWDGTYKGEIQTPGLYTYDAEVEYLNGKKITRKGTITLIR